MTAPATGVTPADAPSIGDAARARPKHTLHRRLLTGALAAVTAGVVAAGAGARATAAVQQTLGEALTEAADQGARLAQSNEAALRFVALAEAELLAPPAAVRDGNLLPAAYGRADSLAAAADSLRQALLAGRTLSTADRRHVERVGALQGEIEVRLAVARAFRDVARPADAATEAARAAAALDALVGEANAVAASQTAGAAAARHAADARVADQQRLLLAVLAVALLAGAALAWATVRSITAPLDALVAHAGALSRGDFAARTDVGPLPGEFAALGAAMNHASGALDTLQAQLTHQAHHDPLTGLANRARFRSCTLRALTDARAAGAPERVALLAIDLDGFKAVNDRHGHAAGDHLLVEVAARLLNATRGCDTVARLGGDEFAVLLENVRHDDDLVAVAERVVEALGAPIALAGSDVNAVWARVGASVGVARADDALPAVVVDAYGPLARRADVALYDAKARGRRQFVFYDATRHATAPAAASSAPLAA